MFTYSNTTEAMWFPMSSKTAEPNTISLPWNFCCIETKLIEMRNKYKMKNSDSPCAGQWHTLLWGPTAKAQKSLLDDWRIAKSLPPPSVETSRSKAPCCGTGSYRSQ